MVDEDDVCPMHFGRSNIAQRERDKLEAALSILYRYHDPHSDIPCPYCAYQRGYEQGFKAGQGSSKG